MTSPGTAPWRTTGEAEHAMLGLTAASMDPFRFMATHFAGGAVFVTSQTADGVVQVTEAHGAADPVEHADLVVLHRDRRGGRLFRFPGSEALAGTMTVAQLVAGSAVDAVVMIGHREPLAREAYIDTQGFVRPLFLEGRTVLVVRPAADGLVVPFEQPDPTPCCAEH